MGSSKKFWLGIVIGAVTGGAVSLLEKSTRQSVKEDFSKVSGSVAYVINHPQEFIDDVKDAANKVRITVEQVTEDVAFITEKVEEIKAVPSEVSEIVNEAKLALSKFELRSGKQE